MWPSIHFLGHEISVYGIFLSIAHLGAIGLSLLAARRRGLPLEPYVDLFFAAMLAGLVGGRAAYILLNPSEFSGPASWIDLRQGGLSSFGALGFALPAYLITIRWRGLPVWQTSDLLAPVLAFSLGLIRLGCLSAGCCYGHATELPWGIHPVSNLTPLYLQGSPLHPTQAYEAIFLFCLGAGLAWLAAGRHLRPGRPTAGFLLAYGIYRLATNPLRADLEPWLGRLSGADLGAFALCVVGAALLLVSGRNKEKA